MELSLHAEAKADAVPLALVVQSLNILALDAGALEERIQEAVLENPLLEAVSSWTDNDAKDLFFAQLPSVSTMADDLHQQLGFLKLERAVSGAAALLIDSLDEDGYLREDLSVLAAEWHLPEALLRQALTAVQSLEPTGVGSRDLAECLRLQLLAQQPVSALALEIVDHHLPELAARRLPPELGDPEALSEAAEVIRSLSPRPCAGFGAENTQYIVPDIRVCRSAAGVLTAELINQPGLPVISPLYRAYLQAGSAGDRLYVQSQLETARNFIGALQMRARTLEQIARFLITEQHDYFLLGPQNQRTLSLSALAEALEVSVSTVSRAVGGKYIEYEGRVTPLRALFPSNGAGELSRAAIIDRIRALLRESPGLSDGKLALLLEEQGIHLSRRTVNKYRNLSMK